MRKGIVIKYIQKNYMGKELKLSLEKVQLNTKETVMQEMRDKTKKCYKATENNKQQINNRSLYSSVINLTITGLQLQLVEHTLRKKKNMLQLYTLDLKTQIV